MDQNNYDPHTNVTDKQPPLGDPSPAEQPSPKRRTALITTVTVAILVLLGGLGYMLARDLSTHKEITSPAPATTTTPEDVVGAKAIVEQLKTKVTGEQQKIDAVDQYGGTGPTDGVVFSSAAYQSSEQKFAVYPSTSYGFGTWSKAEVAASDKAIIAAYLDENEFSETATNSGIYASTTIVCAVTLYTEARGGHDGVGLGCGDIDDYTKSYQAAEPFYLAYIDSKPESVDNLLLAAPTIKDGVDGYKNAFMSITSSLPNAVGGFVGLFYFTPDANSWSFFKGTQNDLACDVFNSVELKRAFAGQRCIESATEKESTVQAA